MIILKKLYVTQVSYVHCKIMEKLIRKKIVDHFHRHNLFSNRQFGFIGERSTALQLLVVLEHWTSILDEGGAIDAIYTAFMKAFDKVLHKRLINKLKSYRISDQTCLWIRNFLSNRKQRVEVNGELSQWHNVTSGIPQGSVLGPILFVVFINDLPDCVDSEVFMFADDTKLYRTIAHQSDIQTVQNDINNLFNWSEKWLLCFHLDKCKVLPITTKHSSNRENERYQMPTYEGSITTLVTLNCEKDVHCRCKH